MSPADACQKGATSQKSHLSPFPVTGGIYPHVCVAKVKGMISMKRWNCLSLLSLSDACGVRRAVIGDGSVVWSRVFCDVNDMLQSVFLFEEVLSSWQWRFQAATAVVPVGWSWRGGRLIRRCWRNVGVSLDL